MISVTNAVESILAKNTLISQVLDMNLLNMSEYARLIKSEVETLTQKKVNTQTVVISLARLKGKLGKSDFKDLEIDDIQLKYPLSDIVYSKNPENNTFIQKLHKKLSNNHNKMINIIQGNTEINIFINSDLENEVVEIFGTDYTFKRSYIAGVILKFDSKYITEPGYIFAVVRSVFLAGINIIEVLSTYTEITIFINFNDTQKLISALNKNFKVGKK